MPTSGRGRLTAVLTDIEGTTTPIAFVRDTLFPYARTRLASFLEAHADAPAVADCLAEVTRLAAGQPVLAALLGWMDQDAKVTPLKTLQGLIWDEGYARGDLVGQLYPDVPPMLRRWRARGLRLYVYSSGSVAAQRLLFGHSDAGDLAGLFTAFFDTGAGAKHDASSYRAIARGIGLPAGEVLFLSDVVAELDAAAAAGLATCQLVRAGDGTVAGSTHPVAGDFSEVEGSGLFEKRTKNFLFIRWWRRSTSLRNFTRDSKSVDTCFFLDLLHFVPVCRVVHKFVWRNG